MERSAIIPHISWSGPQPEREMDAYLLAMLLRMYVAVMDEDDEKTPRDSLKHPSILTTENIHYVAIMYAFYKEKMEEHGVRNIEDMLKLIKSMEKESVTEWLPAGRAAVTKAEKELIDYVETPKQKGFTAFG